MTVKVIVYMHITPNGMIARLNGSEFSSKKARAGFLSMMKKVRVNIIGRGTFEAAVKKGGFPMEGLNIVVTKRSLKNPWKNVIVTDKKPEEILKLVEENGYSEAMVGGGKITTSFITANLVDEFYFDVEPVIFGRGIRLFSEENFDRKLKLLDIEQFSRNEVRLHYRVLKRTKSQQ
jgi:dihydrofolate reductase